VTDRRERYSFNGNREKMENSDQARSSLAEGIAQDEVATGAVHLVCSPIAVSFRPFLKFRERLH